MASQKDIQSLIDDIDSILPKAGSRLPWSKPGDVAAQRQVLERVRRYLVSQQHDFVALPEKPSTTSTQAEVAQQLVRAVTQEINFVRADLMELFQADLDALRQQREALVREIRQLERTRQEMDFLTQRHTPQQQIILESSQELINRCAASLTQQLNEILANWEARWVGAESTTGAIAPATSIADKPEGLMQPQERLEQLRQLQAQSDRLLINLDADQRAIFEALQRNLHSYQESLSQGLEKMHSLGVQGETLFAVLVNRLAQQLGREASTLLQSSLQLSEPTRSTNDAATSRATPEVLPLSNASGVTEQGAYRGVALTPQPNPLPELQIPLQLIEQPTEQISASSFPGTQEATAKSEPIAEESLLENLKLENWDVTEELDFENLNLTLDDNDELETFIQLDIDSQASFAPTEESYQQTQADTQDDLDSLLGLVNETSPSIAQASTDEAAELDKANETTAINSIADRRRQEIEDLYQNLFGTDSLVNTTKPDETDVSVNAELDTAQLKQTPTDFQGLGDEPLFNGDSKYPLSSHIEDVLFEGLTDPAAEHPQAQQEAWLAEPLPESWQTLFFEDSTDRSPVEADLEVYSSAAVSPSSRESDRQGIETITALTDLFEEMGLSQLLPTADANSLLSTPQRQSEHQTSDTQAQASLVEDNYIPALPEEDLLPTDELDSEPEVQIWLDRDTLQQLSEDLDSFEDSTSQTPPRHENQRLPGKDVGTLPVVPDAVQIAPQNQWFPRSEELLAEDWEEFAFQGLSDEDSTTQRLESPATTDLPARQPNPSDTHEEDIVTTPTRQETPGNSAPGVPGSVESDFEPDLFPSEALELDQENAQSLRAASTPELAMSEEPLEEDEKFIEMLWDEPIDSTTEEAIASSELEFDLDIFREDALDSQQQDIGSNGVEGLDEIARLRGLIASEDEVLHDEVLDDISIGPQETTLPSPTLKDDPDSVLQQTLDSSQQKDAISEQPYPSERLADDELDTPYGQASALDANGAAPPTPTVEANGSVSGGATPDSEAVATLGASELAIPEDAIAPDRGALTEDKPLDSLTQEVQQVDKQKKSSNSDPNL